MYFNALNSIKSGNYATMIIVKQLDMNVKPWVIESLGKNNFLSLAEYLFFIINLLRILISVDTNLF